MLSYIAGDQGCTQFFCFKLRDLRIQGADFRTFGVIQYGIIHSARDMVCRKFCGGTNVYDAVVSMQIIEAGVVNISQ